MEDTINFSDTILNSINTLFSRLFSSVDNTTYSILDNIVFIDTNILKENYFARILGTSSSEGILLICNSLVLGFIIYYSINYLISHLTNSKIDSPKQFIFKAIIFIAMMNSSFWICEQIIHIISLISDSISFLCLNLYGFQATFSNLIENINKNLYLSTDNLDIFSFDGIIKSFTSIGLLNLIFTYSLRYIMIQIFILLCPFAFLSLITNKSEFFFKIWLKNFISLLLLQVLISLILLLSFSIDISGSSTISKFLFIGIIFSLTKASGYMKEIFGSISISINSISHYN